MVQAAGAVQANLGRTADLIQNFKQVAVDQSRAHERAFDLAEYLDEIVQSLQPRFKGTAFSLVVDCPPRYRHERRSGRAVPDRHEPGDELARARI